MRNSIQYFNADGGGAGGAACGTNGGGGSGDGGRGGCGVGRRVVCCDKPSTAIFAEEVP